MVELEIAASLILRQMYLFNILEECLLLNLTELCDKIINKEFQCGVDKTSIAFFISPKYDYIAAACLCKQKYLFVWLHAHIYFNEDINDVIRLACVLHCAFILFISIFLLRVLCLGQRPKEIKCKAKLVPQTFTVCS